MKGQGIRAAMFLKKFYRDRKRKSDKKALYNP